MSVFSFVSYIRVSYVRLSLNTTLFSGVMLRTLMPASWNAYSGSLILSFLMSITGVLMLQRSLSCTVCKFYNRLEFLGLDCNHETFVVTIFKFLY